MNARTIPHPRIGVVLRDGERVSTLELFFDLVFVLAVTRCTGLMAHDGTWTSIGQGLVVLGLVWWAWVGYSWLTSVVDPDEGAARLVLFAAMAAVLVAALCIPDAFGDAGLTFALAYTFVRAAHIALFVLASPTDEGLRHSVAGLAVSTLVGTGLLVGGSFLDADAQLAVWAVALLLDMAGPLVIDTSGWRLVPGHFAERHGLIMIVALGESIVAIGTGAGEGVDAGVIAAAVLGIAVVCAFWWIYFDVTSLAATKRLAEQSDVRARNELARDGFSYLHLPMVAGIVLVAFGIEAALAHPRDPLGWEQDVGLVGGAVVFVASQVAFKRRVLGSIGRPRAIAAVALVATLPIAHEVDALATLAVVTAVLWALIAFEVVRYGEARDRLRHGAVAADGG